MQFNLLTIICFGLLLFVCHTASCQDLKNVMEGVGDEVTLTFSIVIAFIVAGVLFLFKYHTNNRQPTQPVILNDDQTPRPPAAPFNEGNCPICLQRRSFCLETNCGHAFCGRCLMNCWRVNRRLLDPMLCPICRQPVNMVFSLLSDEERNAQPDSRAHRRSARVLHEMNDYNRTYSNHTRSWSQMLVDSPVLIRHLLSDFLTEQGIVRVVQFRILVCVLGGLFYLLSPIDAIPEMLLGPLGLLDDILVLFTIFIYISTVYRHIMINRATDHPIANQLEWSDSEDEAN